MATYDPRMIAWMGSGLAASKPTNVTIDPAGVAMYYATDTDTLYAAVNGSPATWTAIGPAAAQEWNAGTVTTLGSGLTLSGGTLSASGGGGGGASLPANWPNSSSYANNGGTLGTRGNVFVNPTPNNAVTIDAVWGYGSIIAGETIAFGAATLNSGSVVSAVEYSADYIVPSTTTGWLRLPLANSLSVAAAGTFAILPSLINGGSLCIVENGNPMNSSNWSTPNVAMGFNCPGIVQSTANGLIVNGQTLSYSATTYTSLLEFEWHF